MKRAVTFLLAMLTLGAGSTAFAGQFYGGKGLLHTNAALTLPPGALDLSFYARGFVGSSGEDYFISNGTAALASSFGFSRRVELGFTQILYQDLNKTPRIDQNLSTIIPGNTYLRVKYAGFPVADNIFYGGMAAFRYRVAKYQNVHLEPYQGEGIEIELSGLLSYYVKPLYPDEAPSYHVNVGLLNHNDGTTPTEASQEINYLASALFPRPRYDFGFELYGSYFYKRPAKGVLGGEDWIYLAPLVRYKLFKGLAFTVGLDLLLVGDEDKTIPTTSPAPNYANWRLSGKINFTPSTAFYAAPTFAKADAKESGRERRGYSRSGGDGGSSPMFSRQELFRWGIEERGGDVQAVDLDLERLRQERKRAEEELNALKAKLEERQKAEKK